jgi:type VI protein secretion system component VasK
VNSKQNGAQQLQEERFEERAMLFLFPRELDTTRNLLGSSLTNVASKKDTNEKGCVCLSENPL